MEVINVKEKFELFEEQWQPHIIGSLNGQDVKIAKVQGSFVWHDHAEEDELFYIIKGSLDIHMKDGVRRLETGDMMIVPRGVQHKPVASEECWILLFEPQNTKHTGDVISDLTVNNYKRI